MISSLLYVPHYMAFKFYNHSGLPLPNGDVVSAVPRQFMCCQSVCIRFPSESKLTVNFFSCSAYIKVSAEYNCKIVQVHMRSWPHSGTVTWSKVSSDLYLVPVPSDFTGGHHLPAGFLLLHEAVFFFFFSSSSSDWNELLLLWLLLQDRCWLKALC